MEKNNEKAQKYDQLIREHDALDYQISKLRATNAGINIPEHVEKEIYQFQLKKEKIQKEIQKLFVD